MNRRRELRTTVILSTAAFLSVLGTLVYIALRNSKDSDTIDTDETQTDQERLVSAANSAAAAACVVLNTEGNIAEALEAALAAYAEGAGTSWRAGAHKLSENVPCRIRCKIGTDIVTLSIDTEVVRVQAVRSPAKSGVGAGADVAVRIAGAEAS